MVVEHVPPCALRVQRTSIEQRSRGSLGIGSRQKIQLLLRAVVLTCEKEKLEQESTALGVERIGLQLFAKRLDCLPQFSFAVKPKWCHFSLRDLVRLELVGHGAGGSKNSLLVLRTVVDLDLVVAEGNALGRNLTGSRLLN